MGVQIKILLPQNGSSTRLGFLSAAGLLVAGCATSGGAIVSRPGNVAGTQSSMEKTLAIIGAVAVIENGREYVAAKYVGDPLLRAHMSRATSSFRNQVPNVGQPVGGGDGGGPSPAPSSAPGECDNAPTGSTCGGMKVIGHDTTSSGSSSSFYDGGGGGSGGAGFDSFKSSAIFDGNMTDGPWYVVKKGWNCAAGAAASIASSAEAIATAAVGGLLSGFMNADALQKVIYAAKNLLGGTLTVTGFFAVLAACVEAVPLSTILITFGAGLTIIFVFKFALCLQDPLAN